MSRCEDLFLSLKKKLFRLLGRRFMVTGTCTKCGNCCTSMALFFSGEKVKNREDFKRLCEAFPEYDCFKPKSTHAAGFLVFSCTWLTDKNLCSNYRKRPQICRRYPDPATFDYMHRLPATCGYTLITLKEFDEFLYDEVKKLKE
jgi:uncharacterized protein